MIDYQPLAQRWRGGDLDRWASVLDTQIAQGFDTRRYGDLPGWLDALASLPAVEDVGADLDNDVVGVHSRERLCAPRAQQLETALRKLHPWRKGPFDFFGLTIDTEWRSDWKWNRLANHIAPLRGRRVLDVGCGSGYHCWRMLGAGADEVIGIDPSPLFIVQFWALQHYVGNPDIWALPVGIEQLPGHLAAFDTVFSMGVLYHRRSPLDHLVELRDALRPGGQLVLETLVIEGGPNDCLVPAGRYARMGNVWFIPSCDQLATWLGKVGLKAIERVDVTVTGTDEQRSTDWMRFQSLADFLDPNDPTRTIEGYPAPRRAIFTATK